MFTLFRIAFRVGTTTTTTICYSHYSGTKVKKKNENIRNYRKRVDRNYITICTIFESVCNSQSSKAFELAAGYLQVKKALAKERNNI